METKAGGRYRKNIDLEETWTAISIPFSSFTPASDWNQVGKDVCRIVVSAVHSTGQPNLVKASLANFSVRHAPKLSLQVIGQGKIRVPSLGVSTSNAEIEVERDTPYELEPLPDEGFRFVGWIGSEDCADGVVLLSENQTCIALFENEEKPGQREWTP